MIREIRAEDMPAIHALVHELAVYEKDPESHTVTAEEYLRDWREGWFFGYVALDDNEKVVGILFMYKAYSTWRGRMLYLDDFIVTEAARGNGIGKKLFDVFLEEAKKYDCFLVKWQVLDWNEPAINFYKKYNTIFEKEWLNGKIFIKS